MEDEQIFRVILVLGFVAVFPVALYHRLKAHASKDRLDRRQEGIFILLTLTAIPTAILWRRDRHTLKPGCCRQGGYDLRASKRVCPECGTAVPKQETTA